MSARLHQSASLDHHLMPRSLHPLGWWIWSLSLAAAASATSNPLLLLLVIGVLGLTVASRRTNAPWARAFKYYVFLAMTVIGIRVVFRSLFGGDIDAQDMHVIFTLPHLPLPSWMSGVQLGGPVTWEGTLSALYDGLRLGTMLCCVGAANALANPKRVLRLLPGALYELGVAVVVALTVAPQLVESVQRVRRARKLRGGAGPRRHVLRTIAIPVLQDSLERSLQLAAGMDSRGYGRTGTDSARTRFATGALLLLGMGGLCVGVYGLMDSSSGGALGLTAMLVGAALCCSGLVTGSRRVSRSRYRPDPWKVSEWVVVLSGAVPGAVLLTGAGATALGLNPSTQPLNWPSLPLVPALAISIAAIAAIAAPPPVRRVRSSIDEPEPAARPEREHQLERASQPDRGSQPERGREPQREPERSGEGQEGRRGPLPSFEVPA